MKQSLSLPGSKEPCVLLYIKGFFNGRFGTAALSSDNHLLTSSYISGKCQLYQKLCHDQVVLLERDLSAVRTEAGAILLALRSMTPPSREDALDAVVASGSAPRMLKSRSEAKQLREAARLASRAAEASAQSVERMDQYLAERAQRIQRLVEIKNKIQTRENTCREALIAAASALRERMCAYGHGVLLRPVRDEYLPALDASTPFCNYLVRHQELMSKIESAIEEEV